MNSRIKELRKSMKLSQEEFGKILGITKSGVSDIEACRRNVTEQHIIMLKMANVNGEWIRTGKGKMFIEFTRDEEISNFIGTIQCDEDDTFKKRLVAMLAQLNEEEWEVLEKMAVALSKDK